MYTIIEELIIRNCTRFLNKGTKEIHYTPKNELQLVLGSNGFGKSSLLDAASPLPPNKKDFTKGGYKYVRIRHNNCVYILEADFKAGAKYSFIKEGSDENLNAGRTLTIQKKLVQEHFGYTQEIHDLLLGRVNFVGMTTSQRKEWIVKLCPSDTSFAMTILKEADKQINQTRGTIKKTKEKLFKLQSDLVSDAELQEIKSSIRSRLVQLEELTPHIDNTATWTHEQVDAMSKLEVRMAEHVFLIKKHGMRLDKSLNKIGRAPGEIAEDYVGNKLSANTARKTEIQATLKKHLDEYMSLEEMIRSIATDGEMTTADIEERLQVIVAQLSSTKVDERFVDMASPEAAQKQAVEVSSILDNLLSRMPDNPDMALYGPAVLANIEEQLSDKYRALNASKNRLASSESRKQALEDLSEVDCPECNTKFFPGVKKGEKELVAAAIVENYKQVMALEEEIKNLTDKRAEQDKHKDLFIEFGNLVRDYPLMMPLWDECKTSSAIYEYPKTLYGLSGKYVSAFQKVIDRNQLLSEKATLDAALKQRKLSSSLNEQSLHQRLSFLEKDIAELTKEASKVATLQESLELADVSLACIQKEASELEKLLNSHLRGAMACYKAEKAELVSSNIRSIQSSLASLQERLHSNESKLAVCSSFDSMVEELSTEMTQLRLLSDILSPFDGLVSEILNDFLSDMTGAMNGIARRIWTNKFMIHRCGIDKNGLNYKFPVTANDLQQTVSDISEGSEGEMEFTNFLFTMVARLYLDLNCFPLFFDEVGKMFTEEHRKRLYGYVKTLIEAGAVGQVFVVSHFSSTHNSLVNADFNYIDPTGLTVPENGNTTIQVK